MRNNNQAIVKKLTKRYMTSDKKRNFFIIMAISLTAMLLASVFSVGISVAESQEAQVVRLNGSNWQVALNTPPQSAMETLQRLDYVKTIGTSMMVGHTDSSTPNIGNLLLTLNYIDKTAWEQIFTPAYTDIVGTYPQAENEVMIPRWILDRMSIEPIIGTEIPLVINDLLAEDLDNIVEELPQYSEVFVLSGWYTSYSHIQTGSNDGIAVSQSYTQKYWNKTLETNGAAYILFGDGADVAENYERIKRDIEMPEGRIALSGRYSVTSYDDGITNIIMLGAIIAIIVFTGYLLIYNALYISVSRDVRFYGLLKTVGTTPRQLRKIVTGLMLRLSVIGIIIGLAFSVLISFAVIPWVVSAMDIVATGAVVSFSPAIYIGAAAFALLTALLSAWKPAKKAAGISPIEAQKFIGSEAKVKRVRSSAHGDPRKMAFRNIFRERKRAVTVQLSLFLGLSTFIIVTTVVASISTDKWVDNEIASDFVMVNNTADATRGDKLDKFDDAFINAIKNIPGFESVKYDTLTYLTVTNTDAFGVYIENYIQNNPVIARTEEDKEYLRNNPLVCIAVGVDANALLELDERFDTAAFERGEYLLLASDVGDESKEHAWAASMLSNTEFLSGIESVEVRSYTGDKILGTVPVGGFTYHSFHSHNGRGARGVFPTLIISNNLMEQLTGGALRSTLYIEVADGYDAEFLAALKNMTDGDYDISRKSIIEAQEEVRGMKMLAYVLGGGIAFVLGLIGVLNFVNVMSVGIMVRKREFAAFESIGMTRKQMRATLIYEGMGYAGITLALALTLGNALAFVAINYLQQMAPEYMEFSYPVIPIAAAVLAILAVCVITPEKAYRSISRDSLVQRIREAE
jgi:putative ABC transport system permease protein